MSEILEVNEIKLLQKQRVLQLSFSDGTTYALSCEYLRVFSPSAEVRGHGNEPMKIIKNKQEVNIVDIQAVGNYAIKLVFDDGHDSGIYSWQTLYKLSRDFESNWQYYQQRITQDE